MTIVLRNPNPVEGWLTVLLTDGLVLACPGAAAVLASFLLVRLGLRLTRGRVGDTLVVGVVSALLGVLTAAPGALLMGFYLFARLATAGLDLGGGGFTLGQWAALGSTFVVGVSWLAAGVLLLRGRRAYLGWKGYAERRRPT